VHLTRIVRGCGSASDTGGYKLTAGVFIFRVRESESKANQALAGMPSPELEIALVVMLAIRQSGFTALRLACADAGKSFQS
jgi:hypothetical protein